MYKSLNNRPCQTRITLVDIKSNETIFYPFVVKFNKCGRFVILLIIHILEYEGTDNVLLSNKCFFRSRNYKYLIGYIDDSKIKPLYIILPKTSVYVKSYDRETK